MKLKKTEFGRIDDSWRSRVELFHYLPQLKKGRISNQNCELRYKKKSVEMSLADSVRLSNSSYYIAVNMHNNERILPVFFSELVEILIWLKQITGNRKDSVFVSIYESGSVDLTSQFLESFSLVLDNIGVENLIITNESDTLHPGQRRINFLSNVRNKAMNSFYKKREILYDYVIFLNDVYFCFEDIIRLLLFNIDIACGMDMDISEEDIIIFRDIWVARDANGQRMLWDPPFTNHSETQERVMNGQPFSVFCCWNGIVVLNASIFYQNITFREADYSKGECSASECSLFCNDVWKINEKARVLMDPHVRVAYDAETYEKINRMYWLETKMDAGLSANVVDKNVPFFEKPVNWTCCPILEDNLLVDFNTCFEQKLDFGAEISSFRNNTTSRH